MTKSSGYPCGCGSSYMDKPAACVEASGVRYFHNINYVQYFPPFPLFPRGRRRRPAASVARMFTFATSSSQATGVVDLWRPIPLSITQPLPILNARSTASHSDNLFPCPIPHPHLYLILCELD